MPSIRQSSIQNHKSRILFSSSSLIPCRGLGLGGVVEIGVHEEEEEGSEGLEGGVNEVLLRLP